MYPNTDCLPIHLHNFKKLEAVVDVIYNPLRTKFIVKAQNRKISAIGGLYMLVAQAFYASRLFQDKNLNEEQIDCIYHHLVQEKENIVLIGMPGSGKSTVGVLLAKALGYSFVDVDLIICKEAGKPLQKILDNEGLDYFLHLEGKIGAELKYDKTVIATGGSMVLSQNAMENLKKNGKVVFIDVDLDEIKRRVTNIKTRGIAFGKGETLDDVYRVRYPLYKKYADITVSLELSSIETTVDAIVEKLDLEKQN